MSLSTSSATLSPLVIRARRRASASTAPRGDGAALGEYANDSALYDATGQIEICDVVCIEQRNASRLVAHTSELPDVYELLDRRFCRGPRNIEHLGNGHLGKRRSRGDRASEDLVLHLQAQCIHNRTGFPTSRMHPFQWAAWVF